MTGSGGQYRRNMQPESTDFLGKMRQFIGVSNFLKNIKAPLNHILNNIDKLG